MTPHSLLNFAIRPALDILPDAVDAGDESLLLLIAIAHQESGIQHRRQIGGPARGWWQFERAGGTRGVMRHRATANSARYLCDTLGVPWVLDDIYEALAWNDILAAGFARLLLYTLPQRLPAIGDREAAWAQYIEAWRPGKPHPERWPGSYATGLKAVSGT